MAVAAGCLSFALGLLGYLLPEVQRLPLWARLVLIALPLVIYAIWWLTPRLRVALERLRWYDTLYESLAAERMLRDAERRRVDELTQILATHALYPASVHTVPFTIVESLVRGTEIFIALEPIESPGLLFSPVLRQGSTLRVVDPADGKHMADVEVTDQQTLNGQPLAQVRDGDGLFLLYLRDKAVAGEPLYMRLKALYTMRTS